MGGKSRLGKRIGGIINEMTPVGGRVYEPFVGGFNIGRHLRDDIDHYASDSHHALIAMYRAIQDGWRPPESLSKEEWDSARSLPDCNPLKAFAGFACSFGGKYFGGYARQPGYNFAIGGARSLRRKLRSINRSSISACDYLHCSPRPGSVIYCDPPYDGTTGYSAVEFSSDVFWGWARAMSKDCTVLVSEHRCPIENEIIFSVPHTRKMMHDKSRKAPERLFMVKRP
jgi:DNA adenine methylase